MRSMLLAAVLSGIVACGGSPQGANEPSPAARDARREADRGIVAPAPENGPGAAKTPTYACGDTVLNDQATSGGEQLTQVVPCARVDPPAGPVKPARILDADSREQIPDPPPPPNPAQTPPPPRKKGPAVQAPTP